MLAHVGKHAPCNKCTLCAKVYPMERALSSHMKLHQDRQEFVCGDCQQTYATASSLKLHRRGKHGVGFTCQCSARFDSPAQKRHHMRKCAICQQ